MHVRWDEGAAATPHGQLVFFSEFLVATGVFERWVSQYSLEYRSANAPDKRDLQDILILTGTSAHKGERLREYAVMVTDVAYPIEAIGHLYGDRADCENGCDELKNEWGMSGFTTRDINRCQTTARACALTCNWWSWYCRAANPSARMEAIASRPLLLAAVGKAASHAGQTTLYLAPLHGKANLLKSLIANIRAALQHVRVTAERFKTADPWAVLMRYVSEKIAPAL